MKQEISSFWYTPRGYKGIGLMELLSIKSFIDNGYKFIHKRIKNNQLENFHYKFRKIYKFVFIHKKTYKYRAYYSTKWK